MTKIASKVTGWCLVMGWWTEKGLKWLQKLQGGIKVMGWWTEKGQNGFKSYRVVFSHGVVGPKWLQKLQGGI